MMSTWRITRRGALLVGLVAVACGGDKKDREDAAAPAVPHPDRPRATLDTAPLTLGVAHPADLAYESGKAARPFGQAAAAHRRRDWKAVRSACEEALQADPGHLEAHRLLASALAQEGEYEKAIAELRIALAGDWIRWGASVESDAELEPLTASPLRGALTEMVAAYREQFARSARGGLLLVARRAPFKEPARPKKLGTASRLASRAEVFAYVKETQRYLRITQTDFQVLGFLASPSGDEIAYVAATHATLADPPTAAPPVLAAAQVGTVSLASPEVVHPAAQIKNARTLAVEYQAGDEIVVTAYDPSGWWGLGQARPFSIDRTDGRARPARPPAPAEAGGDVRAGRRLLVRYESTELDGGGDVEGVATDWNPETGAAEEFVIESSQKRVQLPAGDAAARSSLAWSPDRSRLAFATAGDPCAAQEVDRQSSLYLVDAESGRLRHVFKGATRFHPRFLDAATLAFEDDRGGVRLYDAAVAREVGRLEARGGLAFTGLGALPEPVCKRDPGAPAPVPAPATAPAAGAAPTAPAAGAGQAPVRP
jgi:hypothetical protein